MCADNVITIEGVFRGSEIEFSSPEGSCGDQGGEATGCKIVCWKGPEGPHGSSRVMKSQRMFFRDLSSTGLSQGIKYI